MATFPNKPEYKSYKTTTTAKPSMRPLKIIINELNHNNQDEPYAKNLRNGNKTQQIIQKQNDSHSMSGSAEVQQSIRATTETFEA